MSEIITKQNEQIVNHFKLLDNILKSIEFLAPNSRPLLNGERYLTDSELSKTIKVSRRTLQQWRTDGIIPYIIFSGKVIYKESDIFDWFKQKQKKFLHNIGINLPEQKNSKELKP